MYSRGNNPKITIKFSTKSVKVVFCGNVLLIANLSKTITTLLVKTETVIKRDALFLNRDLNGSNNSPFDLVAFKIYAPTKVIKIPIIAKKLGLSDKGGRNAISRVKIGPNDIKGQIADKSAILIALKPTIWEKI